MDKNEGGQNILKSEDELRLTNKQSSSACCKRIEEELLAIRKKYEELLHRSQKVDAVRQLTSSIAHDFNNTFTAIIGFGNLLLTKMEDNPVLKGYVEQILAASEKSSLMVQDLLIFSRTRAITRVPVDLNELVKKLANILCGFTGKGIEVKTVLADRRLVIEADAGLIEQLLINLTTNARDAMPDGGIITIRTEAAELDTCHIMADGYLEPALYALLSFEDTGGAGMDEETKKKIFEPFFSTKGAGDGTGLGLSVVCGIIRQHNGLVSINSEPGKGTVFKVYLPLAEREAVKQAQGRE